MKSCEKKLVNRHVRGKKEAKCENLDGMGRKREFYLRNRNEKVKKQDAIRDVIHILRHQVKLMKIS